MDMMNRMTTLESSVHRQAAVEKPPLQATAMEKPPASLPSKSATHENQDQSSATVGNSRNSPVHSGEESASEDDEERKESEKDKSDSGRRGGSAAKKPSRNDDQEDESDDEEDDPHKMEQGPYESYNAWLAQREKAFPFKKMKMRYYLPRYTLMSFNGRMCEYVRFGIVTGFPSVLYPSRCRKWWDWMLVKHRVVEHTTEQRVATKALIIPPFMYHASDVIVPQHGDSPDLPPNPRSLRFLPEELRIEPPIAGTVPTRLLIPSVVKYYVRKMKEDSGASSASGSATDNEASLPDKAKRVLASQSHKAQQIREVKASASVKSETMLAEERGKLMTAEAAAVPPLTMSQPSADISSMARPSAALYYKYPGTARELDNKMSQMSEVLPSGQAASDYHMNHQSAANAPSGVLGSIWNLLDDQTRFSIIATRHLQPMSDDLLLKREKDAISAIVKFDGYAPNAPAYFAAVCVKIGQYPFKVANAVRILLQTVSSSAITYMNQVVGANARVDQEKLIPAILGQFREHYMGANQISYWRRRLMSMKLMSSGDHHLTLKELEAHYSSFVSVLNNLRICDNAVQERDAMGIYLESLPQFLYLCLVTAKAGMQTLEELHRAACTAVRTESDSSMSRSSSRRVTSNMHSTQVTNGGGSSAAGRAERSASSDIKDNMICFHCGNKGHSVSDRVPNLQYHINNTTASDNQHTFLFKIGHTANGENC
jgi:hypothetical protein